MPSKNLNITRDSLDQPNAGQIPTPENHSFRGLQHEYVRRPTFRWDVALLLGALPGLLVLVLLVVLWFWAGRTIEDFTASPADLFIAWTYRVTVVLAVPVLILAGVIILILRGMSGFWQSRIIRMQNNQPADVVDLLAGRGSRGLLTAGLESHYDTEKIWAAQSSFRNIAGVYSPTTTYQQVAPAQLGPGEEGDDQDPDLQLPPSVDLDDIAANIPDGHIGYGTGVDGQVITAPIGRAYHALRQGDTGTGKTTNLNGEIVQIHRAARRAPGKFELYAGDFKGELDATWSMSPLFIGGIAVIPAEITDMLEDMTAEISRRYTLFTKAGRELGTIVRNVAEYGQRTGDHLPWRLVYLDEINTLLGGTIPKRIRERVDAALKRGLQLGRGAGVFYECGAQYMTADLFDREGSKQFVTRAYFGGWDVTAMNMIFLGKVDREWGQRYGHLLNGTPGRGVYAGVGGQPVPMQGLNTSIDNILQAINLHKTIDTPGRSSAESLKDAFRPSETAETSFTTQGVTLDNPTGINGHSGHSDGIQADPVSVDLLLSIAVNRQHFAQRIREMKAEGQSKKGILLALFNARPGATDDWKSASSFFDSVV